jgi:DNA polymerase/3'-5' exonuclease PolX
MCSLQMPRNQEIANLLFDVAEGLQANGERGFRVTAYGRAGCPHQLWKPRRQIAHVAAEQPHRSNPARVTHI